MPSALFNPPARPMPWRWHQLLLLLLFAAGVLAAKFWLIAEVASAVPFWDQWDGEAANLYLPWLEGRLGWQDLLAAHNEHRIFTTRLLDLLLLQLRGYWDPLLQMRVNAVIHVGTLCALLLMLLRLIGRQYLPVLLAFALPLFALPYAWENTLAGFQVQFYLVLLFSLSCLYGLTQYQPLQPGWWLGLLSAILAFLSLASGLLALLVVLTLQTGQLVQRRRASGCGLAGLLLLAFLLLVELWLTPVLPGSQHLKADSLQQLLSAFGQIAGWPLGAGLPAALVLYLPGTLLAWQLCRRPMQKTEALILALWLWGLGQCLLLAYGRAPQPTVSRYLDLASIGLLVNFGILLHLSAGRRWLLTLWLLLACLGLLYSLPPALSQLQERQQQTAIQQRHVMGYLADGDFRHLQGRPLLHLPYPNPERLRLLLDEPVIRHILAPQLKPSTSLSPASDGERP